MTEYELQQYLLYEYPQENAKCEWKEFKRNHRDRNFHTWYRGRQVPVVPYEGKGNAQYHKYRRRYSTMHIDEKTIRQALQTGERVMGKREDV